MASTLRTWVAYRAAGNAWFSRDPSDREGHEPQFPELEGPVFLLGTCALVDAFAHHYRCELAADAELLQRIGHPPGDALPAGLMILSALAGFCRSSSPSVLQRAA